MTESSASDRQGSNFESCVWRTVSSQSSHDPQEVLLAQFSLYVHKGGLKPDSFHFLAPGMFGSTIFLNFCKDSRHIDLEMHNISFRFIQSFICGAWHRFSYLYWLVNMKCINDFTYLPVQSEQIH